MKNKLAWNLALIALLMVSVAIAAMPNAAAYYYPDGEGTVDALPTYGSFFDLNEDVTTGICLPLAGLLSGISLMLAVAAAISKKKSWLKGVAITTFWAMFFGALPIVVQTEIRVLPNVCHPIAAGGAYLLAKLMQKKKEPEEAETAAPRLDKH